MARMTASQLAERLTGTEQWQKILTDCGTTAERFDREVYWAGLARQIREGRKASIERSRIGWYGGEMVEVLVILGDRLWIETSIGRLWVGWSEIV